MADEAEAPAPVEEVEMSVLEALKEVSKTTAVAVCVCSLVVSHPFS